VPADRDQAASAPREPGRVIARLALGGGGEPGVGVPAQHRPGAGAVELAEGARPGHGQFAAEFLVAGQQGVLAAAPPGVQFQHRAPHVAR
jgi:hypothetical protein